MATDTPQGQQQTTPTYTALPTLAAGDDLTAEYMNTFRDRLDAVAIAIGIFSGDDSGFTATGTDGNLVRSTGAGLEDVPSPSVGKYARLDSTSHGVWEDAPSGPTTIQDIINREIWG